MMALATVSWRQAARPRTTLTRDSRTAQAAPPKQGVVVRLRVEEPRQLAEPSAELAAPTKGRTNARSSLPRWRPHRRLPKSVILKASINARDTWEVSVRASHALTMENQLPQRNSLNW